MSHVVFDKTGTLTRGKLSVQAEEYPCGRRNAVHAQLLGLVAGIKHPVAIAIAAHLVAQGTTATEVEDIKSVIGKGVEGRASGVRIRTGNSRWLQRESDPQVKAFLAHGYTVFCVVIGTQLSAIFGLEDSLRAEAAATVAELQRRGVRVSIVSGDDDGAVQSAAAKLGVSTALSQCSPADKRDYVAALAAADEPAATVTLFCGDGANDAVVLAQATIGVHINATWTSRRAPPTRCCCARRSPACCCSWTYRGLPCAASRSISPGPSPTTSSPSCLRPAPLSSRASGPSMRD